MTTEEAYRVLGLVPPSGPDEVKRAYRRLALESHPDRHPDSSSKALHERRFREAREAYSTLVAAGFPDLPAEPEPVADLSPKVAGRSFAPREPETAGQAQKLGLDLPWRPQSILLWAVGLPAAAAALAYFVKTLFEALKGGGP